jgi:hypothetical protein
VRAGRRVSAARRRDRFQKLSSAIQLPPRQGAPH